VILGLLVATAAAFVVTEHLKLIKSPIYGTEVTKAFSPVCHCATAKATIGVKLRHTDRLTVTIVDSSRHTVATLVSNRREQKGRHVFTWNGHTDAGTVVSAGHYQPQIKLADARRTILLPNVIQVVTAIPKVLSVSDGKGILVPGSKRTIAIRYTLNESAHAAVYLDGHRVIRGRPSRAHDAVKWNGTRHGRILAPGRYVLSVGALDLAGNETPKRERKQVVVTVRLVAVSPAVISARPQARFSVRVATVAPRYAWRLGGKHGTGDEKVLHLRAPRRRGRYRLVISVHGETANAIVHVGRK